MSSYRLGTYSIILGSGYMARGLAGGGLGVGCWVLGRCERLSDGIARRNRNNRLKNKLVVRTPRRGMTHPPKCVVAGVGRTTWSSPQAAATAASATTRQAAVLIFDACVESRTTERIGL